MPKKTGPAKGVKQAMKESKAKAAAKKGGNKMTKEGAKNHIKQIKQAQAKQRKQMQKIYKARKGY